MHTVIVKAYNYSEQTRKLWWCDEDDDGDDDVMMVMMMVIVMLYEGYTADGWISMQWTVIDEDATSSSLTGINIELDHQPRRDLSWIVSTEVG